MEFKVGCDFCGKITPQTQEGKATASDAIEWGEGHSGTINFDYILLQCVVCENVSLHYFCHEVDDENLHQLFPIVKDLSGVPLDIAKSYSEATKVKNISPLAFVTLIRRSLEYVCKEKKAVGKDLKDQLEDLGKREVIPQTLAEMSHVIRIVGNTGAHADNTKIEITEAKIVDDFFIAVLEYVYVAPEKLKKVESHFKK